MSYLTRFGYIVVHSYRLSSIVVSLLHNQSYCSIILLFHQCTAIHIAQLYCYFIIAQLVIFLSSNVVSLLHIQSYCLILLLFIICTTSHIVQLYCCFTSAQLLILLSYIVVSLLHSQSPFQLYCQPNSCFITAQIARSSIQFNSMSERFSQTIVLLNFITVISILS